MALNQAQLMAVPGGPGVVGAVQAGTGISISTTGVISAVTNSGPNPPPAPSTGTLWYNTSTGQLEVWDGTQWVPVIPTNIGTVTSVNVAGTNGLSTTGGPITSSGTITVDLNIQSLPVLP